MQLHHLGQDIRGFFRLAADALDIVRPHQVLGQKSSMQTLTMTRLEYQIKYTDSLPDLDGIFSHLLE